MPKKSEKFSRTISLKLTTINALKKEAEQEGKSINEWISIILDRHVEVKK